MYTNCLRIPEEGLHVVEKFYSQLIHFLLHQHSEKAWIKTFTVRRRKGSSPTTYELPNRVGIWLTFRMLDDCLEEQRRQDQPEAIRYFR